LVVNPAYEHNSGLKGDQVVGKRISEVLPNFEPMWFSVVQQVLQTGKAQHVEGFNMDTHRWYSQYIFKHREGQVGAFFKDCQFRLNLNHPLGHMETKI
jgi:hypothetical protein